MSASESPDSRDSIFYGVTLGCGAQLVVLIVTGVLIAKLGDLLKVDFGWCLYAAWLTQWFALAPLIRIKRREESFRTVQGLLIMGGLLMLTTLILWAVAADLTG